jgi:hypothetical protein
MTPLPTQSGWQNGQVNPGGSWGLSAMEAGVAYRSYVRLAGASSNYIGFRLARSVPNS